MATRDQVDRFAQRYAKQHGVSHEAAKKKAIEVAKRADRREAEKNR
jgi:hypothetical protein